MIERWDFGTCVVYLRWFDGAVRVQTYWRPKKDDKRTHYEFQGQTEKAECF